MFPGRVPQLVEHTGQACGPILDSCLSGADHPRFDGVYSTQIWECWSTIVSPAEHEGYLGTVRMVNSVSLWANHSRVCLSYHSFTI